MSAMASQITTVSRLFAQPFVQVQIKENTKAPCVTGLWEWNPPVTGGFPSQKASNAENVPFDDVIMEYAHSLSFVVSVMVRYHIMRNLLEKTNLSITNKPTGYRPPCIPGTLFNCYNEICVLRDMIHTMSNSTVSMVDVDGLAPAWSQGIRNSLVMRFANDFHSWLHHSWKSLANRLTRDPKIVIHGNSFFISMFTWI